MNYRLFEPEDFDDLYAIEEACFEPPFRFGRRYMRELTESIDAATWIAEENGEMAGFSVVEWGEELQGVIAYIQTIEVLLKMRGRGIGDGLMHRVHGSAHAAGAVKIWLHVDETNLGAIRLYRAHGYEMIGRAENYYPRRRHAEIYVKSLQPSKASAIGEN